MKKQTAKKTSSKDPRRNLPSMTALLEDSAIKDLIKSHTRTVVLETLREVLAAMAKKLEPGGKPPEAKEVIAAAEQSLSAKSIDRIRPVVNALGILLHTGLGRAPLAKEAAEALANLHKCCNLQIDLDTGERGKRNAMSEQLICRLTGAEAAVIVNNNAAATFLILAALCKGQEVIISRGQLIEIGGSFRLPDCMRQSGCIMKEVGTTNKTHLRDYEGALNENTAAIMRVHPSNYRVIGFTKAVSIAEMASLKKRQPFILIDDLGCGALVDLSKLGLPLEPTVPGSLADGADLVCSSGDKLIGGPQAGLIMGRKDLVQQIKKHPMTRLLRVCKLSDIALQKTLSLFLDPETLVEKHPVFRMMTVPMAQLKRRAAQLKNRLEKDKVPLELRVGEDQSAVGGGSMPDFPLDTYVLAIKSGKMAPAELNKKLRAHEPPVLARISKDEVVLDMRTLLDGEEKIVYEAIKWVVTT
jgi:L-seryl-tRNA(Ser) seleniumtransferase